ncbi:MAG: amidohydrolase family protein [Acidobacteria bacterium]|nr:amidohydrolase family protein [Acidobacteriota bacterium]
MRGPALALFVAAFVAGGCASAPRPAGSPAPPLAVIDAHVHTRFDGQPDASTALYTREGLAAELRANHVVGAVAMDHAGQPFEDLVDLGVVHCLGIGESIDPGALDVALATGNYRCIKIYLGYVQRFAYDQAYEPVYQLARRHRVPVVFHTGDTDSAGAKLKYADPLTIDEVAVDHPDVTFVLAHAGNPWIESAAEVAYKNLNVVIDGSAFVIGDLDRLPPETIEEYAVRPIRWIFGYVGDPRKLMFGTDWPLVRIAPYLRAFQRAVPREHWRAVFHDNAARVYGFDARP